MCSDLQCASNSRLIDMRLPVKAAKRALAQVTCGARDAVLNPYSQSWEIPPDPRPWELVESINKKLTSWPQQVPKDDVNCIALKDGTVPCWFRLKVKK